VAKERYSEYRVGKVNPKKRPQPKIIALRKFISVLVRDETYSLDSAAKTRLV